ncbi:MAG: glycosyltransferase family 4 protein [Nitrospinota bacterium]|nr:glycosyltransferase family 4 protein [Nitrospinota bacterium]
MIITFLLPHVRISGGVKALLKYANLLKDKGHEIHLVIPQKKTKWYRFAQKLKNRLNETQTLAAGAVDWFDNRVDLKVVLGLESQFIPDADILVASSWETAYAARDFPPQKGRPFYFIQHHEALWTRNKEKAKQTYTLPFHKIVVSTWLQEILADQYRQDSERLVTPVELDHFFCHEKQWNQPPRICLLHHDYDWKGYADGITAINKVMAQNIDLKVTVFGEKLENPQPLFRSAGFEFDYHYRPTGDSLQRIYTESDIYLCPSWHEGLGMTAMEAMACRAALVSTDTGGCRDYAIPGETALLSQPRNPDTLAENLSRVITDPALMKQLSATGHQKIREFDWQENCSKLIRLFEAKR